MKVQNLSVSIISILFPVIADKIELMSIADSSRTVISAQLSDFMDILSSWNECFLVNK